MREKFAVRLTPEERNQLEHMVRAGRSSARVTTLARILLKTDEGWSAPRVAQALDVSEGTVFRLKRRFAEDGLEAALKDRVQARRYRKLDDRGEAHLIALACSPAPQGHDHWTLRLLAGTGWWSWGWRHPCPTRECGTGSKKRTQALAEAGMVHPQGKRRPVAHMEDVLDLYAEPYGNGRWSVSTRRPSCWPRSVNHCPPSRGDPGVRTTSTAGRALATCSWPASPWRAGGTSQ